MPNLMTLTLSDPEIRRVRLNKLTHLDFCTRSSVRLVCIDVHSERIGVADSDDCIAIDSLSSVFVFNEDRNKISILNTKLCCVSFCHVDMSLSDDDAFFKLDFALWSYKLTSSASLNITRLSDRCVDTD